MQYSHDTTTAAATRTTITSITATAAITTKAEGNDNFTNGCGES